MVLEPQWEAMFAYNSYGFRPGKSHHDAIEKICSNLSGGDGFIANVNLSRALLRLDNKFLISFLQGHPCLVKKVKEWLRNGLAAEYLRQSSSFDQHVFCLPNGVILAPLLINIVLNEIILTIRSESMMPANRVGSSNIVCYGPHLVITAESPQSVDISIQILQRWFSDRGVFIDRKDLDVRAIHNGFNFLNHQILVNRKREAGNLVEVVPSKQAIQLFNQKNREIIQSLKSGPIKLLIKYLRPRILHWGAIYSPYYSQPTFMYIDKVLFSQLRAAVLRRHPRKSKHWINNKYFPSRRSYYFGNKKRHASWILTDTSSLAADFLPRIQWVERRHSVKAIEPKSVYDRDVAYWNKRSN
nr:hypothetical protein [Porphyrostromium japonicum]